MWDFGGQWWHGGHGGGIVVLGFFGCSESDREAETEIREKGEIDNFFIILLYNLYYFNVFYCKIKVGMLGLL